MQENVRPADADSTELEALKPKLLAKIKDPEVDSLQYLKKVHLEVTRLLTSDVHDIYREFINEMPSLKQLSALKNYLQYKIQFIINKKHTHIQDIVMSIIELITQEQQSQLITASKNTKKRALEPHQRSSSDTSVDTSSNNWLPF